MGRIVKDSGIEWIGQIPEEWELKRIKALFIERKEKNDPIKTDFILSLGANYGVVPYSEKEGGGNKAKDDLTDYRLAYPNDIVMNSMNIISGSVGISKYFGCVSPVYYMLYPRKDNVNNNFYCQMFQTKAFQRSLLGLGNGILIKESANGNFNTVRMRIPMEKLSVQLLPVPPLYEQQKIADFLDAKCAEIDNVIIKTEETIEEYKKLKQSVITQAITKGIRGDRTMKDSGIEWIGEIPEEWSSSRFKFVCQINTEFVDPQTGLYDELPHIGPGNIEKFTGRLVEYKLVKYEGLISGKYHFYPNEIVYGKINPQLGKVAFPQFEGLCSADAYAIHTFEKTMRTKYLLYFMLTRSFIDTTILESLRMGMPKINSNDLMKLQIIVPPLNEQDEIISYIDAKGSEIDKLIDSKQKLLEELQSYKKSVIYEYVTGKKEAV